MKKNIFRHNRLIKPICEKITNHRYSRLIGWTESFSKSGYKYANRNDFHYKCKICGYVYFNHRVSNKDLEYIKRWDKENEIQDK